MAYNDYDPPGMDRRQALATLAGLPVTTFASVDRMEVKPGQALMIRVSLTLSHDAVESIRDAVRQAFGNPDLPVLVLGPWVESITAVDVG